MTSKRTALMIMLVTMVLISACAMKKPTTGVGQCKTQCSLDYPEKLTECRDYCDCAYKGASIADKTNGSPKKTTELACRAIAKKAGVVITD
ncbi:MAG: hypothetical protein IMF09_12360 [Proteobacteria bacterium]|nr:hypothetical protein [Pseudomonadota bacterium]